MWQFLRSISDTLGVGFLAMQLIKLIGMVFSLVGPLKFISSLFEGIFPVIASFFKINFGLTVNGLDVMAMAIALSGTLIVWSSVARHEAMGKVERTVGVIKERTRACLAAGGGPPCLWSQAAPYVACVHNFAPRVGEGSSPYELRHGKPFEGKLIRALYQAENEKQSLHYLLALQNNNLLVLECIQCYQL